MNYVLKLVGEKLIEVKDDDNAIRLPVDQWFAFIIQPYGISEIDILLAALLSTSVEVTTPLCPETESGL